MTTRSSSFLALALAAGALAGCAPAGSSTTAAPAATTTLLTRLGVDTVSMEQYTRTASGMEGMLVSRVPVATVARYRVALGADAMPTSAEISVRRADGTMPSGTALQSLAMRFTPDSIVYTGRRAGGDTTRAIAGRGMRLPAASGSWGLMELATVALLASGRDSMEFAQAPFGLGARATTPYGMRRLGGDSVRFGYFGSPFYGRHDGRGGWLWLDGSQTAAKYRVDRVAGTDLEALARTWGALQAAGPASTRDTARATIGSARLWVDYGRPLLRGRDVWRNGVLGDTLWRTGANAATQLRTSVDLLIGGQSVPAGTYSLWTWAGRNGYHLVVNAQSGQWGTEYNPARDVVRVPLRESEGAPSVERFTITLEPQGATTGQLVMAWGTKRLSVPIATR